MRRLLLLPALLLAACATAPDYGPAAAPSDFGYRDRQIEDDRYRVSYRAESAIEAEDGALRRAADLAVANGYDWFTVVNRDIEAENRSRSGPSVGIGGSTGSWRSGVGVGVSLPLGGGGSTARTVYLEVVMGNGDKPEGPTSYDARSILSNLSPMG